LKDKQFTLCTLPPITMLATVPSSVAVTVHTTGVTFRQSPGNIVELRVRMWSSFLLLAVLPASISGQASQPVDHAGQLRRLMTEPACGAGVCRYPGAGTTHPGRPDLAYAGARAAVQGGGARESVRPMAAGRRRRFGVHGCGRARRTSGGGTATATSRFSVRPCYW
jgi:hypothetical protein